MKRNYRSYHPHAGKKDQNLAAFFCWMTESTNIGANNFLIRRMSCKPGFLEACLLFVCREKSSVDSL